MTGLKRCILIMGLALLLPGTAGSARGIGDGWQVQTSAVGIRPPTLEGGRALTEGNAWVAAGRCVMCYGADGLADDAVDRALRLAGVYMPGWKVWLEGEKEVRLRE